MLTSQVSSAEQNILKAASQSERSLLDYVTEHLDAPTDQPYPPTKLERDTERDQEKQTETQGEYPSPDLDVPYVTAPLNLPFLARHSYLTFIV